MILTRRGRRVAALVYWTAGLAVTVLVTVVLPTIALHVAHALTGV